MKSTRVNSPRAVLAGLQPIGPGSARVESFDGYLWRLARAHRVSLAAMKTYVLEGAAMVRAKVCAKRADLPSVVNAKLVARLPTLTMVPASGKLGVGALHGRLGQNFVLRKKRCWCIDCIAEMEPNARYWPLVWNLEGYSFCTRHGKPVARRCPRCAQAFDLTTEWLPLDPNCPKCKADVCEAVTGSMDVGTVAGEVALSTALEDFCAEAGKIPAISDSGREFALDRTIEHALETGLASSLTELASVAGMTPLFFEKLRRDDGALPNLSVLARLSIATGVPIAGILYEPLWRCDGVRADAAALSTLPFANGGQRRDFTRMVAEAREAVERDEGAPLVQLAARHGVTTCSLRAVLGPELASEIKKSASRRRGHLKRQVFDELVSSMALICRELGAEGATPSAAAVARRLNRVGEHRYFMDAYRLALEHAHNAGAGS